MDAAKQMLIERDLTQLIYKFSHCMDKRRYVELVDLFTEDGSFDRVGQILNGRAAIAEAMSKRHGLNTRHCIYNILFTRVDDNEAEATMYVANFVGDAETNGFPVKYNMPAPAFLEFDDLYARTPEGWRIKRRFAKVIMMPDGAGH